MIIKSLRRYFGSPTILKRLLRKKYDITVYNEEEFIRALKEVADDRNQAKKKNSKRA